MTTTGLSTSTVSIPFCFSLNNDPNIYLLQSTGLYLFSFTSTTAHFSSVSPLVNQNYQLSFSSILKIFYVVGQPFFYLVGYCPGQSRQNGTSCTNFTCSDPNCRSCPIGPDYCGFCNEGYSLSINSTCLIIPPIFQNRS